ncbi:hypothetical protein AAHA92_33485 [Salvia divinorum]|uniref:Uncharacterized protein n=1 Tax=Salvia divinorum TaxID=28513 RepID=A0ABD1FP48_SALDI
MECSRDERRWCCYHPTEMVVGVCALCLNEKLLVVAAAAAAKRRQRTHSFLPKIFALTNLRLIKHHRSDTPSSPSAQDSFISIKFGENGVASWEKGKTSKIAHDEKYCDEKIKSVVEHTKPHKSLRWRRRIGHLFHLIKRKRPVKATSAPSTLKGRMLNIGG